MNNEIKIYQNLFSYLKRNNVISIMSVTKLCEKAESICVPDYIDLCQVKRLGDYAFSSCTELKELYLPETIETIGTSILMGTKVTEIVIPKNIKEIAPNAFSYGKVIKFTIAKKDEFKIFLDDGFFKETAYIPLTYCFYRNSYFENFMKEHSLFKTTDSLSILDECFSYSVGIN